MADTIQVDPDTNTLRIGSTPLALYEYLGTQQFLKAMAGLPGDSIDGGFTIVGRGTRVIEMGPVRTTADGSQAKQVTIRFPNEHDPRVDLHFTPWNRRTIRSRH